MATVYEPKTTSGVTQEAPPATGRFGFNVDQYYKMAESGILQEDDRVGLIDGDVLVLCPISPFHAGISNRLARILSLSLKDKATVTVGTPRALAICIAPESLVRKRRHAAAISMNSPSLVCPAQL